MHIRDQVNESPITGGLLGTSTIQTNWDIALAVFSGPGWGNFAFKGQCNVCNPAISGMFQGPTVGFLKLGVLSAAFVSQGSGGSENMIYLGTARQITPGP